MSAVSRSPQATVSIWLDDLHSGLLTSGELERLKTQKNIKGVTTNPAIFATALRGTNEYQHKITALKSAGSSAAEAVFEVICSDVQQACKLFTDVYETSNYVDGYVSVEVDPAYANDKAATVAQAIWLWERIDSPNLMIKVPATDAGLEAVTVLLAKGINVNVTLVFGATRFRQVVNAHQTGLELAAQAGKNLQKIAAVASVFISRFDSAVSAQLQHNSENEIPASSAAPSLLQHSKNQTGIANATLITEIAQQQSQTIRAKQLQAKNALPLRLLWASTGPKDPQLDAAYYVQNLAFAGTVCTVPPAVLTALQEEISTVIPDFAAAAKHLDELHWAGIDYSKLSSELETAGLAAFSSVWQELLSEVTSL